MNIFNLFLLSLTICIDSFLLCLLTKTKKKTHLVLIPTLFSIFQIGFIYLGFCFGDFLEKYIVDYLKYIVFLVFSFMAIKLLIDAIVNKSIEKEPLTSLKPIFISSILTSFDSLFLGMPLAFNNVNCLIFITIIGSVTFIVCSLALLLRRKLVNNLNDIINLLGAIILFFFAFHSLL